MSGMILWLLAFIGLKREQTRDEIIQMRYGVGERMSDIARSLGLSTQRVYLIVESQTERTASVQSLKVEVS